MSDNEDLELQALQRQLDDAFETTLQASLEEFDAVLFDVVRHEDVPARFDRLAQSRASPRHRRR